MRTVSPEDRYVAWVRFNSHDGRSATTIHLCDSDAPGAFRVYRWQDVVEGDERASLRHFLSAALVFGREGDAHTRTMAAFDEWFRLHDAAGVPAPTFCAYCGGNDETPQDHCMDCQRPGNVPVCSSCGGAGCVDCATDGVPGKEGTHADQA